MAMFHAVRAAALVLLIGAAIACSSPTQPDPGPLKGGIVATFDVSGERFRVWITNAATIEQVLAASRGSASASIPNGRLVAGAGMASHNVPYSWHLDPEDIQMAEVTIELCDGRPSYVEQHRDAFIREVGRYCPWGARLVSVGDHR
jgi:hypothetical protein